MIVRCILEIKNSKLKLIINNQSFKKLSDPVWMLMAELFGLSDEFIVVYMSILGGFFSGICLWLSAIDRTAATSSFIHCMWELYYLDLSKTVQHMNRQVLLIVFCIEEFIFCSLYTLYLYTYIFCTDSLVTIKWWISDVRAWKW